MSYQDKLKAEIIAELDALQAADQPTIPRWAATAISTGDPRQLPLPGFDRRRLRDYYVVERDGEEAAVCIFDMADEELEAKSRHHDTISSANAARAQEIRRFIMRRREKGAARRSPTPFPVHATSPSGQEGA